MVLLFLLRQKIKCWKYGWSVFTWKTKGKFICDCEWRSRYLLVVKQTQERYLWLCNLASVLLPINNLKVTSAFLEVIPCQESWVGDTAYKDIRFHSHSCESLSLFQFLCWKGWGWSREEASVLDSAIKGCRSLYHVQVNVKQILLFILCSTLLVDMHSLILWILCFVLHSFAVSWLSLYFSGLYQVLL